MANILVVGKLPEVDFVKYINGYKGADREGIPFPSEYYDTDHLVLKVCDVYEILTEKDIYLHDIEFAKILRDTLHSAYPTIERELIEIVSVGHLPEFAGKFLGYDIIDGSDSNILRVILVDSFIEPENYNEPFRNSNDDRDYREPFSKIIHLISKNFVGLLNENQLFKTYEEASLALNIIDGLFKMFRKSHHHSYEVVKIYTIEEFIPGRARYYT